MQELLLPVCYEVCINVPTQLHALKLYNPSPPKSIWSDDNVVFIRVFNSTSQKATPLHKQYMESMVPHESRGMTQNDAQASTRPYFPSLCERIMKGKGVGRARLVRAYNIKQVRLSGIFICSYTWLVLYVLSGLCSSHTYTPPICVQWSETFTILFTLTWGSGN